MQKVSLKPFSQVCFYILCLCEYGKSVCEKEEQLYLRSLPQPMYLFHRHKKRCKYLQTICLWIWWTSVVLKRISINIGFMQSKRFYLQCVNNSRWCLLVLQLILCMHYGENDFNLFFEAWFLLILAFIA